MAIVNIHMQEEDKKKLQHTVKTLNEKSISEFMRKLVAEKVQIEECAQQKEYSQQVIIPDYIPKNKYVAIVNGAIAGIGDSVTEVSLLAVEKFPNLPLVIKYNGPKPKQQHYAYMSLSDPHCWKYINIEDWTYPVVPLLFKMKTGQKSLFASIDTAATVSILGDNFIPLNQLKKTRTEHIATAGGVIEKEIFLGSVSILDTSFEIEFIIAPLSNQLPFQFLIGRNLLDQLDAYFLGKKQLLLLKLAE
jgi:predicted aspartyl protease